MLCEEGAIGHREGFFRGAEAVEQHWQPDTEPRAIIVIVHGYGEHSGRYRNIVNPLVAHGYAVYGHDHRGHGRSPGQRVYINRWEEYREDLGCFLNTVGKQEPGRPVFLFAHSMGALVGLDFLLHYPQGVSGAIISGAPIEPAGVNDPFRIAIARILSGVWPRFSVNLGLDITALSRNPNVVKAYADDPLVSRMATARWGTEILNTVAWVKTHAAELTIPILFIHGESDRVNRVQGTRYLFQAARSADKTLRTYPGGYHEPHNDIDHEKVVADIREWLDRRS
jgi:alpha-beta hydrolase superfamily lysophospholipase